MTAEATLARRWRFDTARSTIGFSVRHMVVSKVSGVFTRWTGAIEFDEARPESSSVEVHIDAGSIDTHDAARDAYLRSAGFFDVTAFPEIAFASKRVERIGGKLRVVGVLTIRGLARSITLDVTQAPSEPDRVRFTVESVIDRTAFGLRFEQVPDVGGVAVGNKIEARIAVELVPAEASATSA